MADDIRVTIDGPTASGKTTLGMELSRALRMSFLDTGLTFRAISYALGRMRLRPTDDWSEIVEHRPLSYEIVGDCPRCDRVQDEKVFFRGEDVSGEIFAPSLEPHLAAVSSDPEWRTQIRQSQERLIQANRRIVVVGRDTAVTLMKRATLHVALTASHSIRRERRRAQYRDVPGRSTAVGPASERDLESAAAIRKMRNSLALDTSYLPAEAVVRAVFRRLEVMTR